VFTKAGLTVNSKIYITDQVVWW